MLENLSNNKRDETLKSFYMDFKALVAGKISFIKI